MLWVLVLVYLAPRHVLSMECSYSSPTNSLDGAGSFTSDLWYWPDHIIYYRSGLTLLMNFISSVCKK